MNKLGAVNEAAASSVTSAGGRRTLSCFDKAMMRPFPFPHRQLVSEIIFTRADMSFLYVRRNGLILWREHLVFN